MPTRSPPSSASSDRQDQKKVKTNDTSEMTPEDVMLSVNALAGRVEVVEGAVQNAPGRHEMNNLHNTFAMTVANWTAQSDERQRQAEEEIAKSSARHSGLVEEMNQYHQENVEAIEECICQPQGLLGFIYRIHVLSALVGPERLLPLPPLMGLCPLSVVWKEAY